MHDSHHKSHHFSRSNQKMFWTLHMRLPEDLAQKALAKLAAFQPRCAKPRFLSLILDPKNDDLKVMFGYFSTPPHLGKFINMCLVSTDVKRESIPCSQRVMISRMAIWVYNSKLSTLNSSFNWLLFLGIPKPYSHGSTSVLSITTHCTWLETTPITALPLLRKITYKWQETPLRRT